MSDPYSRYPETWRKFTLEQCEEMEKELNKSRNAIGVESQTNKGVAERAKYFGLIPITCFASMFLGLYEMVWWEQIICLPIMYIPTLFLFLAGEEAHRQMNEKPKEKWVGVAEAVAVFAVSTFLARLVYGYLR